ncbi:MAG: hypothetical protein RL226_448 [Bacteroidota bacterium]
MLLLASPIFASAQEAATEITTSPAVEAAGTHYGLPDSVWLGIFMSFAVLFTVIIVTINTTIRNLAETSELWRPKKTTLMLIALLASSQTFAQEATAEAAEVFSLSDTAFWGMAAAVAFLAFYTVLQLGVLRGLTQKISGVNSEEPAYAESVRKETVFSKAWDILNGHVAIEKEKDIMLDHNYDGIRELDNQLPPWWKYGFYFTIVVGIIYLINYHVTYTGLTQEQEYEASVIEAEAAVAAYLAAASLNVDETSVVFEATDERVNGGKSIYMEKCKVCHGDAGQGGVGPNLTDAYWLHGGTINDVFKTVKYGVPAKGMQSWKAQLSPTQIQNVSTYIMTMQGTNPANPKEPQGELFAPAASEETAAPSDSTGVAQPTEPAAEPATAELVE